METATINVNELTDGVIERIAERVARHSAAIRLEQKRVDAEAAAVFFNAKTCKLWDEVALKLGATRNADGSPQWSQEVREAFKAIENAALAMVGERTAKAAYLAGKGDEARLYAELICGAVLKGKGAMR
jgi:hypothetical protein